MTLLGDCADCEGSGYNDDDSECYYCDGSGINCMNCGWSLFACDCDPEDD